MARDFMLVVLVGVAVGGCTNEGARRDGGTDADVCGPANCADGCCDLSGVCRSGVGAADCGRNGEPCADCTAGWCSRASHSCEGLDGGCHAQPVPGAAWETGSCPDAGCPGGQFCLRGTGESGNEFGCAPVPATCQGATPTCACMGCICAIGCHDTSSGIICDNGTISQRAFKGDIAYLSEQDRRDLAQQALQIPLARYRYSYEPQGTRRRLGFIIDEQPNPSPAVMGDRMHVDEYGYTSMLLVALQQQAKDLAALRQRIELLEQSSQACR